MHVTTHDRPTVPTRTEPHSPWIDGRYDSLVRVLQELHAGTRIDASEILPDDTTRQLAVEADRLRGPYGLLDRGPDTVDGVDFLPLDRLLRPAELPDVQQAVASVLPTGRFTGGPWVGEFEDALARFVGLPHVSASSSGTEALMAALVAVGVRPGHEVVIPANSFAATENAVLAVGAEPVLCDVDDRTLGLDPTAIPDVLTSRTAAVLPVHLYGRRADLTGIAAVAAEYGLRVVEDACQAIGLSGLGRHSDAIALSFNPYKNLGACGKAGAIATRDAGVAETAAEYLYHGFDRDRKNLKRSDLGLNARIDNLQAAVLLARMGHLASHNLRRLQLADRYRRATAGLRGRGLVTVPDVDAEQTWHLFTVRVDAAVRDRVRELMAEHGVGTDVYYPVLSHQQPTHHARSRFAGARLPVTERAHAEMVQLPLHPDLTTTEQDLVVEALTRALDRC